VTSPLDQTPERRGLRRDGSVRIERLGLPGNRINDLYHTFRRVSWTRLIVFITVVYFASIALFAVLYLLGGDCINGAEPGSFADAFYFSTQTVATIGYGAMTPKGPYANLLVSLEAFFGMLYTAMTTGLVFSRFATPTARVVFSHDALITSLNSKPTLVFRLANERSSQIVEARINVTLLRTERTKEGQTMRRLYDLPLARNVSPIFALTWLVMHEIDEKSPLFGMTPEKMKEDQISLIVTLTGIDDTLAATVHARQAYDYNDIKFNRRFVDVLSELPGGGRALDFRKFHTHEESQPVTPADPKL
jgi:inward rectifier potassium channel